MYGAYLMMAGWKDGQDIHFTCHAYIYKYFHITFPKENFEPTCAPFPRVELETSELTIKESSRETAVTKADDSLGRLDLHPKEEAGSLETNFFMY
jgi:hypothetical protein